MNDKTEQHTANDEVAPGVPLPEGAANLIETDYEIGQDNYSGQKFGIRVDIHSAVFSFSALTILAFVILQAGNVVTIEHQRPCVGNVDSADKIEERCLSASVRPNDAHGFSGMDVQAYVVNRDQTAEVLGHVFQFKERHRSK